MCGDNDETSSRTDCPAALRRGDVGGAVADEEADFTRD
jgi:hypothetical protein